mgnify:CR=1 FL=1
MSLIIAGERSGVGKTTVTLALLAALARRYPQRVQSFKVGPDYIDPMFHQAVTGRPGRNLDPVLTSEAYVQHCFQHHSQTADYALVEGVMGLFDGATGQDDWASTAHIARLLAVPIVLVVNCSSIARSVAAIVQGYRTFDPRLTLAGLVLNRVASDRHLELLTAALAPCQIPIVGVLRRQDDIAIPDRHLGLVPTAELPALRSLLDRLAHLGETCFDWPILEPLLTTRPLAGRGAATFGRAGEAAEPLERPDRPLRLAIAQDPAFSFYYADNLDSFQAAGFELAAWSPLQDQALPAASCGLYCGGGFPEIFAATLSENQAARQAVGAAIAVGMPTYAECGGLMYLCEQLLDFEEKPHAMVGCLPATARMGQRLVIGYRQAIAQQPTPLLPAGEKLWGHEFHRSYLTTSPESPLFTLHNYDGQRCPEEGWQRGAVHASYLHLHFGDKPGLVRRFRDRCQQFQARET